MGAYPLHGHTDVQPTAWKLSLYPGITINAKVHNSTTKIEIQFCYVCETVYIRLSLLTAISFYLPLNASLVA